MIERIGVSLLLFIFPLKYLLMKTKMLAALIILHFAAAAQNDAFKIKLSQQADQLTQKVITWRRDFHEHPELGNNEVRTAGIIAAHLKSLGIEVKTGVAKTGVVGILRGEKPGPVVALRADMDALPVIERVPISFASKAKI